MKFPASGRTDTGKISKILSTDEPEHNDPDAKIIVNVIHHRRLLPNKTKAV
jgi:hypothetical protein